MLVFFLFFSLARSFVYRLLIYEWNEEEKKVCGFYEWIARSLPSRLVCEWIKWCAVLDKFFVRDFPAAWLKMLFKCCQWWTQIFLNLCCRWSKKSRWTQRFSCQSRCILHSCPRSGGDMSNTDATEPIAVFRRGVFIRNSAKVSLFIRLRAGTRPAFEAG